MDRPNAFHALRTGCRDCLPHHRAADLWSEWLGHRRARLDDEFRHDRERPIDRNRSTLCIALRIGGDLLVELVAGETLALAHLGFAVDVSWVWIAGQRSAPS